jgi:tRNA modification GTPase
LNAVFLKDTIAAISTPAGIGAIGIVRMSGPKAEAIGRRLFRPRSADCPFESYRLYHGDILSPRTGNILDEVLFVFMKGPRTYTGEDTAEIHCHGGPVILQQVFESTLEAGARPAEPGEFTRRAFLNGRLDLSQAEAICDLITAKTEGGLEHALGQLKGSLYGKIINLREAILQIIVPLDASIDFTEEELETPTGDALVHAIEKILGDLQGLLDTYREGRIFREGLSVIITGKANVGKSSLFNRLIGGKRAIVTPIPGTTRDIIEETVSIDGLPIRLADTAGLRNTDNLIEKEGMAFVRERLLGADVVIVVLDGCEPLGTEDKKILEETGNREILPVINKADLPRRFQESSLRKWTNLSKPLWVSAKYGEGVDVLKKRLLEIARRGGVGHTSDIVLTAARHKLCVERTIDFLSKAKESLAGRLSPELAAFDLRQAVESLDEITGRNLSEEILDQIFSTFCIGK